MTFGIDVSGYQVGMDYAQARREGVEFVIVKAAGYNTGSLYVADGYAENVDAVREAGITGVGHYYVVGKGNPTTQADYFVKHLHDFDKDHDILALDNEPLDDNATFWTQDKAYEFLSRVQALTGIPANRIWLYCPAGRTRLNAPWDKITDAGYRIWWSAYGSYPTGHEPDHTPALEGKIDRWDIHQYSSVVPVADRKTIDGNYTPIPVEELFGGAAYSVPAVVAKPKPVAKPKGEYRYTSTEEDGERGKIFYARVQTLGKQRHVYPATYRIDGLTGPATEIARVKLTAQALNGWVYGPHTTSDEDGKPGVNYWTAVQAVGKAKFGYTGLVDGKPGPLTYAAENRITAHELNTHR